MRLSDRGHYGLAHTQKTTFKKNVRWYTVKTAPDTEPVKLPSVTSILDVTMPQNRRDTLVRAELAAPVDYQLRREAAIARGTAVDTWFKRCVVDGRAYGAPHPVERQCRRLLPLVRSIIRTGGPVWVDQVVHHADLGYAGTLDVVATLPIVGLACIELKTSAYTIWPEAVAEAQLQAIAYYLAWNRMHPDETLKAIATFHATPYMLHQQVIHDPTALGRANQLWLLRQRQFASRFNQMEM
ncbi:hypothetical protein IQ265_13790 [Nodosilinea sp. LEGE 06152]|uniref:hypothetical protein n=1 Tax=Nodosilinea sp. LEGE 06152 TaxID=2777966 RepID=UPI0018813C95|nr:hypothetical protein [Nodosilinea sp. LEGE 06152]MBE9157888.1 hypothetical protein [Nodosilinea sp. LEGE 06152]